jgi:DNA-binding response OmpR family regulator
MTPYTLNMNKSMFRQIRKIISIIVLAAFISTSVKSPVYAQSDQKGMMPLLPVPGVMVHLSPEFTSAHLQGITIHPDNALQFDFLIHKGDQDLEDDQKPEEYKKLVKYFLASLTIPDEDQWVNLSPYEKDRIIKDDFGKTEMGRDLLAEDYLLKQITSSLIYPEDGLGKAFWDKVYERAWNEYHTTDIPVNTFNKVWIVPDQAYVYESGNSAYILNSHLRVMLEEDYLSLEKHVAISSSSAGRGNANDTHAIGSQVIREIILPELEKEVNEGKNFANLRQMYSGMILATWYKKALKESLLGKVYADRAKVKGVDQDPQTNEEIYRRYLKAFKKGVFNYIKEDVDKYTNEIIPRKYFSGGWKGFDQAVYAASDTDFNRTGELVIANSDTISFLPKIDMASLASEGSLDRATVTFNAQGNTSGGIAVRTPVDLRDITRKLVYFFNLKYSQDKQLPYFYLSDDKEKIVSTWIRSNLPALSADEMQTVRVFAGQLIGNTDGGELLLAALGNFHPASPTPDRAMTSEKRTAVVADDDSAVLQINKTVLELQGFNVLTAASPSELEEVMANHGEEVSLLVSDTTGWTDTVANVLSKVKRKIPVLAVSGADSKDVWEKSNVPITAFLKKPYGIKQLKDVVNAILPQDSAMTAQIVVVSSDPNLRRMIESDLGTPGVRVLPAASPAALEQAMKSKVSLLVIDTRTAWVSPGMATNNTPALVLGLGLDDMNGWKKKNTAIFNLPYAGKDFLGKVHEILSNDQAMTADARGREFQETLQKLLASPGVAELFQANSSLKQNIEAKAKDDNVPFITRFTEIKDQITNAMPKEQGAFHDSGIETNYRRTLVKRIENILYGKNLLIVGADTFSSILKHRADFYGIKVTTAASGAEAKTLLEGPVKFDTVIFDVDDASNREQLAALVPADPGLSKIPMVLTGDQDAQKDFLASLNSRNMRLVEKVELPVFSSLADLVEDQQVPRNDAAMNAFNKGGIDFNAANLNLRIKRDGRGVPLPLSQQDMNQLLQIQGFVPVIVEIQPAVNLPILSELQQKLQAP